MSWCWSSSNIGLCLSYSFHRREARMIEVGFSKFNINAHSTQCMKTMGENFACAKFL